MDIRLSNVGNCTSIPAEDHYHVPAINNDAPLCSKDGWMGWMGGFGPTPPSVLLIVYIIVQFLIIVNTMVHDLLVGFFLFFGMTGN
jgi:hypothetical protein